MKNKIKLYLPFLLIMYMLYNNNEKVMIDIIFLLFYITLLIVFFDLKVFYSQLSPLIFFVIKIIVMKMGWSRGFYPIYLLITMASTILLIVLLQIYQKNGIKLLARIILFFSILIGISYILEISPTFSSLQFINQTFRICLFYTPFFLLEKLLYSKTKIDKIFFSISLIPIIFELSYPLGGTLLYFHFENVLTIYFIIYKLLHIFAFSVFPVSLIKQTNDKYIYFSTIIVLIIVLFSYLILVFNLLDNFSILFSIVFINVYILISESIKNNKRLNVK